MEDLPNALELKLAFLAKLLREDELGWSHPYY